MAHISNIDLFSVVSTPVWAGQVVDVFTRDFWNGSKNVSYVDYYVQGRTHNESGTVSGWFTCNELAKLGAEIISQQSTILDPATLAD